MSTPNTHYGSTKIEQIIHLCQGKKIFFCGAGGIMMSSLALLTKKMGFLVEGSDRSSSSLTRKLNSSGIEVYSEHSAQNVGENCGALIYTVAISEDNPEYMYAKNNGIPCISRSDYLGYIMTTYENRIGIAGMHGKSTCTSMCAEIFLSTAKSNNTSMPTIISGAEYSTMEGAYFVGDKENFIFEACEYMDSFLDFNPTVAVLLNLEMEHVDYFKNMEQIISSFSKYANLTGEHGKVVANCDDVNILECIKDYSGEIITFGLVNKADFRAVNIVKEKGTLLFDVLYKEKFFTYIKLPACGEHNVYNALAAIACAYLGGITPNDISNGLLQYKGPKRRMEYKGLFCGAHIYDDYAHHPTEIKATLAGARHLSDKKLICVFQPHTYSRTKTLIDQIKTSFDCADLVIVADIYSARESDTKNINSQILAEYIGNNAMYGGAFENILEQLKEVCQKDDVVIVMGAGDVYRLFDLMGL